MEVSFSELKEKEIINVLDGKKLGRIIDILFDNASGVVRGVIIPGEKKLFRTFIVVLEREWASYKFYSNCSKKSEIILEVFSS